jgi:hypothetical protein
MILGGEMKTYSLAEIRNGTGWPKGTRFLVVGDADFDLIAHSLRDSHRAAISEAERKTVKAVALTLAANLSETPAFDSDRFLGLVGVTA